MTKLTRREFFRSSGLAAAAVAAPHAARDASAAAEPLPRVRRFKPFGKTGWMVGDISAGSGQSDPALIDHIFQRGANLIDSAFAYGGHEEVLGKILPKWRKKVFVITKWDTSLVSPTVTKSALLEGLDISLKRLNTTYVDCLMIHSIGQPTHGARRQGAEVIGGIERIQNPAIYEAWDEAKRLKKVRFTGASSHGVHVVEEMGWGVDNNRFEVILVGANFLTHGIEPVLKRARAKGIATIAMKTMTIYRSDLNIRALQNRETNARQACIKWVLASDLFDTVALSMRNYDQVNEYLAVSGTTGLTAQDRSHLKTLEAAISSIYCRPGCDRCYGSCRNGVPIWDILRYRMYFEHYGDQKLAMERYVQLPASQRASRCEQCTAPCERTCPYGLQIRRRLIEAHELLTMA